MDSFRTKLLWKLLGCIIISAGIAIGLAFLFAKAGSYYVDNTFDSQEINQKFQVKYMEELQQYVYDNEITRSNISLLEKWAEDNNLVYFSVYLKKKMIFNSDYSYANEEEIEEIAEEEDTTALDFDYFYKLILADGTSARVDMFCYDFYNYVYYVVALSVVIGILIFIVVFTRLVNRKLAYIKQLEQELGILEGGNLEYPVTIKGSDELGSLAKGIDQMRLSIMENNEKEQKALQANKDLVTAMSHDLRTPLTTLTGYLEILCMDNNADEEKKKHYLELSMKKTKEIRELSDELFEYFLVFDEEQRRIDVMPVPAYDLVSDLIENQFLNLEEDGYKVVGDNKVSADAGNCLINPRYMSRVLNNILSNIGKYADKESPVNIFCNVETDKLCITIKNTVKKNIDPHESTKIGLITCKKIMKLHNGEFEAYDHEGEFIDKLVIPMENRQV